MIALALQKKFANQNFHSPEVDKENENHDFSSADENSPHVPVRALLIHQLIVLIYFIWRGGGIL